MAVINSTTSSPFLHCGPTAEADALAVLHLKRDHLIPTILRSEDEQNEGYDEGKVTNTRFGSFPHSTLIGVLWGSQVRASAVDTGSRGRKGWENKGKKRKRNEEDASTEAPETVTETKPVEKTAEPKAAKEAATGFVHLLPPTPEVWTASLPHRTQVVYNPDYSYILDRIRARPGTVLIEAGAGSGSFTHAAARAVYNGVSPPILQDDAKPHTTQQQGKVFSFEFHAQRAEKLSAEIGSHGLGDIVKLTHQDVCTDGFIPLSTSISGTLTTDIDATSIFLDLPAPWLALKHLTRQSPTPLSLNHSIHLCTFSPCIEQVTRTIATLRSHGWVDISMVEIAARRIEVRRERVGLQEEGLRGVNDHAKDVDEALGRLREVEGTTKSFHEESSKRSHVDDGDDGGDNNPPEKEKQSSKQHRLAQIRLAQPDRKIYKEGQLIHRSEPELKNHTSYLVFAILPREWSNEDEREAQKRWAGVGTRTVSGDPTSPGKVDVGKVGKLGRKARKAARRAASAERVRTQKGETVGDGDVDEIKYVKIGEEEDAQDGQTNG